MKYTNYIINGTVIDIESIIPEKPIIKQMTILGLIPVSIMGLTFLTAAIPGTLLIDGYRALKMKYYIYMKKYKAYKHYEDVFASLSLPRYEREKYKFLYTSGKAFYMRSSDYNEEYLNVPFQYKLKYALSKGSYFLTDRQLQVKYVLSHNLNRGFGAISKTLSHLVIE